MSVTGSKTKLPVTRKFVLVDAYHQRVSVHQRLGDLFHKLGVLVEDIRVNKRLIVNFNDGYLTTVDIVSCTSQQYQEMMRGVEVSEVLIASNIKGNDFDDAVEFTNSIVRLDDPYLNASMYINTSGTFNGRYCGNPITLDLTPAFRGLSYTPDFYFPVTMFRVQMKDLFEKPDRPTRDEFLMGIMMEGISAKTEEEINAVKAAQIYIESKGNNTNPGET